MKHLLSLVIAAFLPGLFHGAAAETLDLSGRWTVALDSLDRGMAEGYTSTDFADAINLPGTTDMAGLGTPNTLKPELTKPQLLRLTRRHSHIGPAWYTRTVLIPASMAGRPLDIELERVLWSSELWVDGKKVNGFNESLTTPHRFTIPEGLTAGSHRLTLRIDNRKRYDISVKELAHAYTDDTQTKWNGVLGRMELSAREAATITDLQVYPDIARPAVKVVAQVANNGRRDVSKKLKLAVIGPDSTVVASTEKKVKLRPGSNRMECDLPMPADAKLWSEFTPALYTLSASTGDDSADATFGMREIASEGKQIKVNGRPVFLRGTLECCVFPLTGVPPTDEARWEKEFTTAREWGMNHLRFHSWCPPEAAFRVADRMGFYLQVELPFWSESLDPEDTDVKNFLRSESERILREYGNHPSLWLLTVGNEIRHDFKWLNEQTAYMKSLDPRHIYATTSFTFEPDHGVRPEPEDDFLVTQWTADGWVRGQGVFDAEPPAFDRNYAKAMVHVDKPLIQHESGQYAVYPRMSETEKYTGTLDPLNFKAIRRDLERKGLLHLADTFTLASGRFAALLYKEEIERSMKTPGFSGYQLLGLQDFPGQGTALVGLVDAFWDSKGLIEPARFSQFNGAVVPLASFPKAVYSAGEPFEADIDLINYSASDISDRRLSWTLRAADGIAVDSGTLPLATAPVGELSRAGHLSAHFGNTAKPEKYTLEVALEGTPYANSWSVWYYPDIQAPESASVVQTASVAEAVAALEQGKKVLLSPRPDSVAGLECKFLPVFWSPVHFPKQAAGMGIYTNPNHRALASFPTDMHTDWQWWHLLKRARTLQLDSLAAADSQRLMPIVGMVDNFVNNRNLGLIAEARCGNGTLIISSIDFLSPDAVKRPEILWMRRSLLDYMDSPAFAPKATVDPSKLASLAISAEGSRATGAMSIYE